MNVNIVCKIHSDDCNILRTVMSASGKEENKTKVKHASMPSDLRMYCLQKKSCWWLSLTSGPVGAQVLEREKLWF